MDSSIDTKLDEQRCLATMPNSVLTSVLEKLIGSSNPASAIKLALTCRALHKSVTEAEGLWEATCLRQGWSRAARRLHGEALPGAAATPRLSPLELDRRWFRYYSARMLGRRNVRRYLKLYIPFLPRPSSMALMPGASAEAIAAREQQLGLDLPLELWELYRYRNGQAPGPFTTFVDDMRLLGLDELSVEQVPGLLELQQQLGQMGVRAPEELARPGQGHVPDAGAAGAAPAMAPGPGRVAPPQGSESWAPGAGGDGRLVAIASNPSRSRHFMVALNGQVFLVRGLSITFFAPSVSATVQKLLR